LVDFFFQQDAEFTRPRSVSGQLAGRGAESWFPIAQQEQLTFSAKIYAAKLMQMSGTGQPGRLTGNHAEFYQKYRHFNSSSTSQHFPSKQLNKNISGLY